MQTPLHPSEYGRYQRHLLLPQVGVAGQLKLKNAKVLCVGAGGLAAPVLSYLAAAGIGTLGIVDADQVEESNLQRQVIYKHHDVGYKKVYQAKQHLLGLNPYIHIETYDSLLTQDNALNIIEKYDIIVDTTDNYAARYLINDACFYQQKPMVYAGIYQFEGQASVFHYQKSPCYRCLYPALPPIGLMQNCADAGVFGALPGLLGTIQATETIKIILALGESLAGRLLTVDTLSMQFKTYPIPHNPNCCLCVQQQAFSSLPYHEMSVCDLDIVITPTELRSLLNAGADLYLLDVRQPEEHQRSHLPHSQLVPLGVLDEYMDKLPRQKLIVVYCQKDPRSQRALLQLKQQGFTQVKYLQGGMYAWEQT